MAATAAMRTRLRGMTGVTVAQYDDTALDVFILSYPLADSTGNLPDESDWVATYDLNAAAADIWEEIATSLYDDFDFTADGGTYNRSQKYQHAMVQVRHFRARRSISSIKLIKVPAEPGDHLEEEDADDSNA